MAQDSSTTGKERAPAFRDGEPTGPAESLVQIRPSGPEATRDDNQEKWDDVDENSDESFPASDPAAKY